METEQSSGVQRIGTDCLGVVFDFVSDQKLRTQLARVCREWCALARKIHKRRSFRHPLLRRTVMPSVLGELRDYFSTIRRMHCNGAIRVLCRSMYWPVDPLPLKPSDFDRKTSSGCKPRFRSYEFHGLGADVAHFSSRNSPTVRPFQDHCPPVGFRTWIFGRKERSLYRNTVVRIVLAVHPWRRH